MVQNFIYLIFFVVFHEYHQKIFVYHACSSKKENCVSHVDYQKHDVVTPISALRALYYQKYDFSRFHGIVSPEGACLQAPSPPPGNINMMMLFLCRGTHPKRQRREEEWTT